MNRLRGFLFLGFVFGALAARAETQSWTMDIGDDVGRVSFVGVGTPSAMKIRGQSPLEGKRCLSGSLQIKGLTLSGEVKCQLEALDTGINLRNKHMREKYLQTDKFPSATFKLAPLKLPQAFLEGDFSSDDEPFSGDLTFHGETRKISGSVNLKRQGKLLPMEFMFKVKLTDFKISPPSFMAVTMKDEVDVGVALTPTLLKN